MNYRKIIASITLALAFVTPLVSSADHEAGNPNEGGGITITNPLGSGGDNDTLDGFVTRILDEVVIPVGAVILVLAIIYTGFLFVTAQGNQDSLKKAKTAFFYTIIGGAVLLGASVLAELIDNTIDLLGNTPP